MIYRWKHPTINAKLWGLLQGFAEIADGVITLTTLAFYSSGFEMWVARNRAKHFFRKAKPANKSDRQAIDKAVAAAKETK